MEEREAAIDCTALRWGRTSAPPDSPPAGREPLQHLPPARPLECTSIGTLVCAGGTTLLRRGQIGLHLAGLPRALEHLGSAVRCLRAEALTTIERARRLEENVEGE